MANPQTRNSASPALAEKIAISRKEVVSTYTMMQSIISGKYLSGLAASSHITITTAVWRIAVFNNKLMQFMEFKVGEKHPNWKQIMLNKVVQSTIMTENEARQVPPMGEDVLNKEAGWSLENIQDYYNIEADTMYHHLSAFGLRLLEELENIDTVDRGLKYAEIVFNAMAKSHNRMGTVSALVAAQEEQEAIHKQNLQNMWVVDGIAPPTNWVEANGKLW